MNDEPTDDANSPGPESVNGPDAGRDESTSGGAEDVGSTQPPPTPSEDSSEGQSTDPGEAENSATEPTADLEAVSEQEEQVYEVPDTQILDSTPDSDDASSSSGSRRSAETSSPPPAQSFLDDPDNLEGEGDTSRPVEIETLEEESGEGDFDLPAPDEVDDASTTDVFEETDADDSLDETGPVQSDADLEETDTIVSRAPDTDVQVAADPEPEHQEDDPDATQLDPGFPQPEDDWNSGLEEAETQRTSSAAPVPDASPSSEEPAGGLLDGWDLPELEGGKAMGIAAGIVVVTVAVALCFGAKFTTSLDAQRLSAAVANAEQHRSADHYGAWVDAFRSTATDLSVTSAPGGARATIHSIGEVLGAESPAALRDEIAQRHAYYAAVIEYRFERSGSRNASELADAAFGSEASALGTAAAIYRSLARGRTAEAQSLADSADSRDLARPALAYAALEAALAAGDGNRVADRAAFLEKSVDDASRYRQFLLARAARFRDESNATNQLQKFLKQSETPHLEARIALAAQLRHDGKFENVVQHARKLLDRFGADASDYQRARLQLEIGRAHLAMHQSSRAVRAFRSAVQIEPGRASVYLPYIDQRFDQGDLERAGTMIDRAFGRASPTSGLQLRRARHAYLTGQFHRALEALDSEEYATDDPILRGRTLIRLERYGEAASVLDGVDASHPRSSIARALRLLARSKGTASPSGAVDTMESLVENSEGSPLLWRSAARLRLEHAERTRGSERSEHLEAAISYAEKAADARPQGGLSNYVLCEAYRSARNAAKARSSCQKARRANPHFVPGILSVGELELALHDTEDVELLLDGLSTQSPYDWKVDALRVRAAIQSGRVDDARKILRKWSDDSDAPVAPYELLKGRIAFANADYQSSLRHLENVQKEASNDAETRLYYTHALVRLGRNSESAATELGKLNDDPLWSAEAWLVYGELRRRQDRFRDALENLRYAEDHFDEAFTSPDQRARLFVERALAWQQRFGWDREQVWENLKKAHEIEGTTTPELDLALGLYHLRRKAPDYDSAISHLHKVIDQQPHRCRAIRALRTAYDKRSDETAAKPPEKATKIDSLAQKHCSG